MVWFWHISTYWSLPGKGNKNAKNTWKDLPGSHFSTKFVLSIFEVIAKTIFVNRFKNTTKQSLIHEIDKNQIFLIPPI
jgi:hypothetical protein